MISQFANFSPSAHFSLYLYTFVISHIRNLKTLFLYYKINIYAIKEKVIYKGAIDSSQSEERIYIGTVESRYSLKYRFVATCYN